MSTTPEDMVASTKRQVSFALEELVQARIAHENAALRLKTAKESLDFFKAIVDQNQAKQHPEIERREIMKERKQ